MTGVDAPTGAGAGARAAAQPSPRALLFQYKRVSLALLVLLVGFAAILAVETAGAGSLKISDSTSCSAWSSATPKQQSAYARLYVKRHGALPSGSTDPASIETAVNDGCIQAFSFDEADTISVLQAIKHEY